MCEHLVCRHGKSLELCNDCGGTRPPNETPYLRLVREMTGAEAEEFRRDLVRGEGWRNR